MIAVDAMGGDYAPQAIVHGAFNASRRDIPISLYGDLHQIEPILNDLANSSGIQWQTLPITLIHTSQIISMGAEPSRAVVHQTDSSLVCAVQAVADGKADAVISAGNSGAALVAGTLILGRIDGVLRPAIGDFLPTKNGSIFCLDLGANTDCKPEYLEQFALMGHVYVSMMRGVQKPRIALLSNGAEPYKGPLPVKEAYARLESSRLNFIGNLEPRDMFDDRADVLVCDGFVGNILLKGMQGTARAMVSWIDQERSKSWLYTLGLLLSKGLFRGLKKKIDPSQKGGALLLGVNHPLIIAHGCSNALAIEQAIIFAHQTVANRVIPRFKQELYALISCDSMQSIAHQSKLSELH